MKIIKAINYKVKSIFSLKKAKRHKYRAKLKNLQEKNSDTKNISILQQYHSVFDFEFNKENNFYTFKDYGAFFERNLSTKKLIDIAMLRIRHELKHSFTVRVVTSDCALIDEDIWAYGRKKGQSNIELIPDFFFDNWPSIGCLCYDDWMKKMVENSKKKYEFDQMFWSGALDINKTREMYYEMSKKDKRLACAPVLWKREKWVAYKQISNDRKLTVVDFPKYKYLIDLPCNGYSGRFKTLLFSGRPVFKVEDDLEEFFYKDLKPFIHYIPIKNDLSDLTEKLEWAESHYDEALQIAKNAQDYAVKNLTFESAINYFEKLILKKGA